MCIVHLLYVYVFVSLCVLDGDSGSRQHSLRHKRSPVRRASAHSAFPREGDEWFDSRGVRRDAGGAAERAGKQQT